jgi:hypothetical protein
MGWLRSIAVLFVLLWSVAAHAEEPKQPQPPPKCTERCFVVTKLSLDGSVTSGTLGFTVEGAVLAEHPVAVPLFGPPSKIGIEGVTDEGKPAAIGFEGDHYFVVTSTKRFSIKGKLTLDKDLALAIPGPVNLLEAKLSAGRLVEGAKLSGLSGATVHFDGGSEAGKPTEPTVFQLSRAFRVLRETGFEYRLVMRSGNDLGVIRLPLTLGEKVLEVSGSTGWKVEGSELVLPTAGSSASITIAGTFAAPPKQIVPDARSSYEWWLVEADAEHRVLASTTPTSAKQVDSAESPLPRTQPSSRLFLAKRGEVLDLSVQTLTSTEALAAVVRDHSRTLVLTPRGDWVVDEQLTYENNGVDHLLFSPAGRAIFLASDGVAERLMHGDNEQLMIGLRKGMHTVRVQSLSSASLARLFGTMPIPTADHPLTTSRTSLTVGLPHHVVPLALLGGDRIVWYVGAEHFLAISIAIVAAWLVASSRRDRVLLAIGLSGVWFLAPPVFIAMIAALAVMVAFRISGRLLNAAARPYVRVGVIVGAGLALLVMLAARGTHDAADTRYRALDVPTQTVAVSGEDGKNIDVAKMDKLEGKKVADESSALGNFAAQNAGPGILRGVAPVALPLPSAHRYVGSTRELVTRERPFQPRLVYVTTLALLPFAGLWFLSIAALAFIHRAKIVAMRARLRELLAPAPAPTPAE